VIDFNCLVTVLGVPGEPFVSGSRQQSFRVKDTNFTTGILSTVHYAIFGHYPVSSSMIIPSLSSI
jgi:hypothetical protein